MIQTSSPVTNDSSSKFDALSTVSRPVSVAWVPFVNRLATVLGTLEEDQFLVISLKDTNLFVQFVCQGSWGVRAETVSNHFRSKGHQLKKSQMTWLVKNGWLAPSGSSGRATPKNDPDGSPNYFIDLTPPVDFDAVAGTAVATFIEIIGSSHPGALEYEARDGQGNSLAFPTLGLKQRVDSDKDFEKSEQAKRLLNTVIGHTGLELEYDQDGDVGIHFEGIDAFIGLVSDRPYARIYSTLIKNLPPELALLERVNTLNVQNGHLHLFCKDGRVLAMSDLLITPLNSSHVAHWISNFCQVAVKHKSVLEGEFGVESVAAPSTLVH